MLINRKAEFNRDKSLAAARTVNSITKYSQNSSRVYLHVLHPNVKYTKHDWQRTFFSLGLQWHENAVHRQTVYHIIIVTNRWY